MADLNTLTTALSLTELKAIPPAPGMIVLLLGKNAVYDNQGGFYRWDPANSQAEDAAYMRVFPSTVAGAVGNWVRVFQSAIKYPQGTMVTVGGVKTFYGQSVTVADGTAQIYLTADNTATGTALFGEIWDARGDARVDAVNILAAVQSAHKSLTTDLKTLARFFFRANPITLAVSGVVAPVVAIPVNTTVTFVVVGT